MNRKLSRFVMNAYEFLAAVTLMIDFAFFNAPSFTDSAKICVCSGRPSVSTVVPLFMSAAVPDVVWFDEYNTFSETSNVVERLF